MKSRLYTITLSLILIIIGLSILIIKADFLRVYFFEKDPKYPLYSFGLTISGLILLLTGASNIVFLYLQGNILKSREQSYDEILDRVTKIEKDTIEIQKMEIPIDSKITLETKIHELSESEIVKAVEKKYKNDLYENVKINSLIEDVVDIKHRFNSDIKRITSIANINLALGFATTIFAITYLIYSLLLTDSTTQILNEEIKNNADSKIILSIFLVKFLPRLTVSIFIELFSFFFLKMYRRNLDEIKYLTNERTNIESKLLALKTSMLVNDDSSLSQILLELSKTERNFILKKGESTVEVEKNKIENSTYKSAFENLTKFLKK